MKFKDQSLFSKIILIIFWSLVAVFAFWPVVIILGIILAVAASLFAILFFLGLALLPVAGVVWLITRA
jgi:hypothetical protein|tara:strand:- start:241 stop:444 length:204 start_codon:yes stop_codon:yes gene_type:complete